jgi:hypothetical protein
LGKGNLRGDIDTFQIIEEQVEDAATVKGWRYLNFGANWRSGYIIIVAS